MAILLLSKDPKKFNNILQVTLDLGMIGFESSERECSVADKDLAYTRNPSPLAKTIISNELVSSFVGLGKLYINTISTMCKQKSEVQSSIPGNISVVHQQRNESELL